MIKVKVVTLVEEGPHEHGNVQTRVQFLFIFIPK